MDNRAVAPVVGKLLAAGIAVLFLGATTSLLFGGVVPEYRTATGEELAERVLADAAATVERAVPDTDTGVEVRVRTDLPGSIRGTGYALFLRNDTLVLDHPNDRLDTSTRLSVPSKVRTRGGRWESGTELAVRVSGDGGNRTIELEGGT